MEDGGQSDSTSSPGNGRSVDMSTLNDMGFVPIGGEGVLGRERGCRRSPMLRTTTIHPPPSSYHARTNNFAMTTSPLRQLATRLVIGTRFFPHSYLAMEARTAGHHAESEGRASRWRRFFLALSLEGGIDDEIEDDYYCCDYYEVEPPWCFCHKPEQGEREPEQRREGIRHDRSGAVI